MSENSKIEWTDATLNALAGCRKCSPGCENCYAINAAWRLKSNPNEKVARKFLPVVSNERGKPNWTGEVTFTESALLAPLSRKNPTKYFVNSLSDLFYSEVPDEWIHKHFAVFALARQHTFQVLTKRPERMLEYFSNFHLHNTLELAADKIMIELGRQKLGEKRRLRCLPLPNVWLGVSVENQKTADERIPLLLQTPAAVHFLSVEPLLGAVDLRFQQTKLKRFENGQLAENYVRGIYAKCEFCGGEACCGCDQTGEQQITNCGIDWVIIGCESGTNRRPMKLECASSIVDQCKASGVPVFVKQIEVNGKVCHDINLFPKSLQIREMPNV